ncbi:MAG: hypothetical protein II780_00580, partial [Clostridia bacterium]|nr:hypothetical protein [Clostridia bacterium]
KLGHPIVVDELVYSHYEGLSEAYLLKNIPDLWRPQLEQYFKKAKRRRTWKTTIQQKRKSSSSYAG